MSTKKLTWHKVSDDVTHIQFSTNNIAVLTLKSKKICFGRFGDRLFAFAYSCPHAGGLLSDGYIDALGNVVCPLHRYKYDMKNGRNVSGEGYYLKNWPVELREDGVYVGVEESGFWGMSG